MSPRQGQNPFWDLPVRINGVIERSGLVSETERMRSKNSYESSLGVPRKTATQAVKWTSISVGDQTRPEQGWSLRTEHLLCIQISTEH